MEVFCVVSAKIRSCKERSMIMDCNEAFSFIVEGSEVKHVVRIDY